MIPAGGEHRSTARKGLYQSQPSRTCPGPSGRGFFVGAPIQSNCAGHRLTFPLPAAYAGPRLTWLTATRRPLLPSAATEPASYLDSVFGGSGGSTGQKNTPPQ